MTEYPVLPPEVISLILEFLPFRERLATAAVCKQWYDLVYGTKFCRQRLVLRVEPGNNLVQLQQNNSLLLQRCRAMQLQLSGIDDEGIVLLKDLLMAKAAMLRLSVVGSTRELKSILEDTLPGLDQLIGLEIELLAEPSSELEEVTSGELGEVPSENEEDRVLNMISDCGGASTFITTLNLANSSIKYLALKDTNCDHTYIDGNFPSLTNVSMRNSVLCSASDDAFDFEELSLSHFDGSTESDDEPVSDEMAHLKKLCLANTSIDSRMLRFLALTELRLVETKTVFASLRDSISAMKQLLKWELIDVTFQEDTLPNTSFTSDSITNYKFYCAKDYTVQVDFPNLECLSYISTSQVAPKMFEQIWINHRKLQRLSFGVCEGQIGKFLTKSSIAHINNLPTLKILQLVRMSLDSADWSQCRHRNQLQKIRLVGCPIDGRGAQQLAATFPELRELFLDHCHLRQPTDAFEIAENFSEQQALRRRLERCRVSYYDCHVEDSLGSC
ncbi:uncharacterized protein LOC120418962 [Culex pipiens pallens]|uniref:uncharacterized protein LOC120418962 n=1 Tax=Culex pipiens pallens TaxID=42434 RepID=UPI0019541859|nr:uncharacterized protein LOC120418962 [Culex pipiens pallens]